MRLKTVANVAKEFKLNRNTLGKLIQTAPLPFFAIIEPGKKRPKIDVDHIAFREYVESSRSRQLQNASPSFRAEVIRDTSAVRKKFTGSSAQPKQTVRTPNTAPNKPLTEEQLADLADQSAQATLEMPIVKVSLEKYKVEQEKLKIQKNVMGIIEWQLAEYLFFGFADRIASESLQAVKKKRLSIKRTLSELLLQRIPNEKISEDTDKELRKFLKGSEINEMTTDIVNTVTREIEETIKNVKLSQAQTVENWQNEEGKAQ